MKWMKSWSEMPITKLNVSTEGFFDIFSKKAEIQRDRSGGISMNDQVKKIIQNNFMSVRWVKEHLKAENKIHLTGKAIRTLAIDGKLELPLTVLEHAKKLAGSLVNAHRAEIEAYSKAISAVIDELNKFYKEQKVKNHNEVIKYGKQLISKVKVPTINAPAYRSEQPKDDRLPSLVVDNVNQVAAKLLPYSQWSIDISRAIHWPGTDWNEPFWHDETDTYDGEAVRHALGEYLYEQRRPDHATYAVNGAIWNVYFVSLAIVDWIGQATGALKGNNVSTEDITEDVTSEPSNSALNRLRRLHERRTGEKYTSWEAIQEAIMGDFNRKYPEGISPKDEFKQHVKTALDDFNEKNPTGNMLDKESDPGDHEYR